MTMMAEIYRMPVRMICSQCGAESRAGCNCGAPYVRPGERALEAIKQNPQLPNITIAKQLGIGETTVRRARKTLYSPNGEYAKQVIMRRDGRLRIATNRPAAPAMPLKAFKARKARYRKPVTEKDQLIAFTRELSQFVMHFSLELTRWLDGNPAMEPAGRDALAHTLEAYSLQLQKLAQRVDGR